MPGPHYMPGVQVRLESVLSNGNEIKWSLQYKDGELGLEPKPEVFGISNRMNGPKNIFELIDSTIKEQHKYNSNSRTYNEMGWPIGTNSTGAR